MPKKHICFKLLLMLLCTTLINGDDFTHQYLRDAVKNLRNLRQIGSVRRADVLKPIYDTHKTEEKRSHQVSNKIPPLSLTKGELTNLYQKAIAKGSTIKLDTGNQEYIEAGIHHYDDDISSDDYIAHYDSKPSEITDNNPVEDNGYYYYYYPIKSFLNEYSTPSSKPKDNYYHYNYNKVHTTYKPPYAYHSHHHQHNISITTEEKKKEMKPLEPLFMAISGFIGMAVMFVLSMVVLPKFNAKMKPNGIKKKEQLDDFARFALNAIDGQCAERFACELSKTARSFNIQDNRFYKLLKRIAPGTFGRYMNGGRYANKQLKCTAIPCIRKNNNKKPTNKLKEPNVKKKH